MRKCTNSAPANYFLEIEAITYFPLKGKATFRYSVMTAGVALSWLVILDNLQELL
jgi:hypothetical protein